jgi:nitroreductase
MKTTMKAIRDRHSERSSCDPKRPVTRNEMRQVLDAARWTPTPHNMQNFEIIVVDDKAMLKRIGEVESRTSIEFLRENYQQLSFSEKELKKKKVGILASRFPRAWTDPSKIEEAAKRSRGATLRGRIDGSPVLLIVLYDPRRRAPASQGDVLGFMGLGCLMENMWLAADSLGLGYQILSTFANTSVEKEVKSILDVPRNLRIAYAVRLGHHTSKPSRMSRVRREIEDFTHHNAYGRKGVD